MDFRIEPAPPEQRRPKPADENALGFGKIYSDHMFTMRWTSDGGWSDPTVKPFADLVLSPASLVLHYGQTIFEGLKAYRNRKGTVNLFRAADNAARFNRSAARLDLPEVDPAVFTGAIEALLELDHDWIPRSHGTSLYVRPTMIAIEPYIGLKSTHEALFFIITGPVGAYYPEGFNPVKITVTDEYSRAGPGGLGSIKTAANYAASLKAEKEALGRGFTQVLWLDAAERLYVEEVGSMNILFKIGARWSRRRPATPSSPASPRSRCWRCSGGGTCRWRNGASPSIEVLAAHEDGSLEEVVRSGHRRGHLARWLAGLQGPDPPRRERRHRTARGTAVRRVDRHPVRHPARPLRLDPRGGASRHERRFYRGRLRRRNRTMAGRPVLPKGSLQRP